MHIQLKILVKSWMQNKDTYKNWKSQNKTELDKYYRDHYQETQP